jgi:hypothetical protein
MIVIKLGSGSSPPPAVTYATITFDGSVASSSVACAVDDFVHAVLIIKVNIASNAKTVLIDLDNDILIMLR